MQEYLILEHDPNKGASLDLAFQPQGGAKTIWESKQHELIIHGPAETGKEQPITSLVYTPMGKKMLGNVSVGDSVLTPDGASAKVVGVYPQGFKDVYLFTFSDGATTLAGLEHLWEIWYKQNSSRNGVSGTYSFSKILTTKELLDRKLTIGNSPTAPSRYWVQKPILEFNPQPVPLDPYALGVLIAEGSLTSDTIRFTSIDQQLIENVNDVLAPIGYGLVAATQQPDNIDIRINKGSAETSMHHIIVKLGLAKGSHAKFIPDLYKYNSQTVRWNLLQGLFDGDGSVHGTGKTTSATYATVSERLADDVIEVVRSLGVRASKNIVPYGKDSFLGRDGGSYFSIQVLGDSGERFFRLDRKRVKCLPRAREVPLKLRSIELEKTVETVCIEIDHPKHLYVTDHVIPTHNTRGCLEKVNGLAWKYPGMQAVIVRKTYASLKSSVLQTFERQVLGAWDSDSKVFDASLTPVKKYGGEQPQFYDYPNRSRIWVGGLDKASRILSSERDIIYVNQCEELTHEDWQILLTRATGRAANMPYAQVLGDANPGPATHWILERGKLGHTKLVQSRHEDNPTLFDILTKELTPQGMITMRILDSLVGVLYKRLKLGLWVSAEGVVYEEFSQDVHIVDSFELPASWPRYITIDFGYSNPFCCLWFAESPEGDFYMYREIYRSQILVEYHAQAIRYLSGATTTLSEDNPYFHIIRHSKRSSAPENIVGGISDHDSEGAATLERYGVFTVNAFKPITRGIEEVKRRLMIRGDGKTGLYFFRDALAHEPDPYLVEGRKPQGTIDEFEVYVYPKTSDGRPVKEVPVQLFNHGVDATRYLLATLFCAPIEVVEAVYSPVVIATY